MIEKTNIIPEQSSALKSMGIKELNEMQLQSLQAFRRGGDMVILSPTGTGKTLAFLLPLLEFISKNNKGVVAVIILPTRELARQVSEVWKMMGSNIKSVCLHGGRSVNEELSLIKGAIPSLVIATPGRLNDHLSRGTISVKEAGVIVLDEFDKALELGFKEEMESLLSQMPANIRRFLLSATDSDELSQFMPSNTFAKLDFTTTAEAPQERTSFYLVETTQKERLDALVSLLCLMREEQSIVFCNFREMVDEVYRHLKKNGLSVTAYHGGMEQQQRELALYKFKSNCSTILICTDLASRGLDIPDVRNVIHYQRPVNSEAFTHRNGRTARWSAEGSVYMFRIDGGEMPDYTPEDIKEFNLSVSIPMPTKPTRKVVYIGKGKRDKISRGDIAGFFMKKGGAKPDDLGTIVVYDRYAYVAIRSSKLRSILSAVTGEKIKGLKTIIEEIKK